MYLLMCILRLLWKKNNEPPWQVYHASATSNIWKYSMYLS